MPMPAMPSRRRRQAWLPALLLVLPTAASGEEVVLRLKGGELEIRGTLQSIEGGRYVVEAGSYGLLRLEQSRFECTGSACGGPAPAAGPGAAQGQVTAAAAGAAPAVAAAPAAPAPERIVLHGSSTIGAGLMPALVRAFAGRLDAELTQVAGSGSGSVLFRLAARNGAALGEIEMQRKGSATAFPALLSGEAQIGMADRRATDAEVAALKPKVADVRAPGNEHVLGRDGLAIVVAPENRAGALALDSIARVFAGRIRDWSELGLPAGRISVHGLSPETGTSAEFNRLVLKPRGLELAADAKLVPGNAEVADMVAGDPNAIGFTALAYVRSARALDIEMPCGLVQSPTPFALKNDEYPFARRLYLYTAAPLAGTLGRRFMQFALSPEAQPAVADSQFIDQSIEAAVIRPPALRRGQPPVARADAALERRLAEDVKGARRLSVTLRFAPGSSRLDARSHQDLVGLARHLLTPELKGRTVLLAGFTDPVGGAVSNAALALGRATQVRGALLAVAGGKLDPRLIGVRGYGPLAPVACNDTPDGHLLNRRVEVWVRE